MFTIFITNKEPTTIAVASMGEGEGGDEEQLESWEKNTDSSLKALGILF